jgi:flagellar protein FlbD
MPASGAVEHEERTRMIAVTRLHGSSMAVNRDLIERVESTPQTVLTLVDGSRFAVRESVGEIVGKVRAFRASVVRLATGWSATRHPSPPCGWCPTPTPGPDHRHETVRRRGGRAYPWTRCR